MDDNDDDSDKNEEVTTMEDLLKKSKEGLQLEEELEETRKRVQLERLKTTGCEQDSKTGDPECECVKCRIIVLGNVVARINSEHLKEMNSLRELLDSTREELYGFIEVANSGPLKENEIVIEEMCFCTFPCSHETSRGRMFWPQIVELVDKEGLTVVQKKSQHMTFYSGRLTMSHREFLKHNNNSSSM